MVRLLIIADDFTGALDTAVQFAKKGIETRVFAGDQLKKEAISDTAQVAVVDSETRPMCAQEAYQTVYRIAHQAVGMGIRVIYKKTDSALRGNVGSELTAVLDAAEGKRLHFIPAFPAAHRVTREGIHYIDGVRLEDSVFGRDPFDPTNCSDVAEILARRTDAAVRSVAVCAPVPKQRSEREILVFDASEDMDIRNRVEELGRCGELHLLAGCAGFAAFLPDVLGMSGSYFGEIRKTERFYVACGSLNPVTEKQVRYAQANGFGRVTLKPEQKLCPGYYDTEEGRRFLKGLAKLCAEKRCVVTDTFDSDSVCADVYDPAANDPDPFCADAKDRLAKDPFCDDAKDRLAKDLFCIDMFAAGSRIGTQEYAAQYGIRKEEIRTLISACHGRIVRGLLEQESSMTIMMTGGDTLMGVMKELGVSRLTPIAEVGQGTVLAQLDWNGRKLQVISKSGGLGEENVLEETARQILCRGKGQLQKV